MLTLNSDVLTPRKIAWNGCFVIHSRSAAATIQKRGKTMTKVVQMTPANPVNDHLYIWQY